jgi:hypothetical protein
MTCQNVSLGLALQHAATFRQLFNRGFTRWETCGHVRRELDGPRELVHVAITKSPINPVGPFDNRLWEMAEDLIGRRQLQQHVHGDGLALRPDAESRVIEVVHRDWIHRVLLVTSDNWGPRVAEHTGPAGYWRMLSWRLHRAGALKLNRGMVCVVDRSGPSEKLQPIPCRDEHDFFRLCRTTYKSPRFRFERPEGADNERDWPRGMLEEWYPPGFRIYADPQQPGLFDTGRPIRRKGGRDGTQHRRGSGPWPL